MSYNICRAVDEMFCPQVILIDRLVSIQAGDRIWVWAHHILINEYHSDLQTLTLGWLSNTASLV